MSFMIKQKNKKSKLTKNKKTVDVSTMTPKQRAKYEKKQAKIEAKKKLVFTPERGFGSPFGYVQRDSYIFGQNGHVYSVFDIIVKYGTNHDEAVGWVNNVIPRDMIEAGIVRFVQRQKGLATATENELIDGKLGGFIKTIQASDQKSAREGQRDKMRQTDMMLSAELAGREQHAYDTNMSVVIRSKSETDVELAVEELMTSYKNSSTQGITLVRRTGEQWKEWTSMLFNIHEDPWHSTEMGTTSAGRLFLPSSGFSDPTGMRVGIDTQSYLRDNPSIINFTGIKNAVIFTGKVKPYVSVGTGKSTLINSGGSALAHCISDANYLSGNRTHHIMLSPNFPYRSDDSLSFDMSKEVINPFEVFGRPETVVFDANDNFEKVTNMMLLIIRKIENEDLRNELKTLVYDWFVYRAGGGSGMYTKDPKREPHMARRILATPDHKNYPTPRDFLLELRANVARESQKGELARRDADILFKSINTAFNQYSMVFGSTTTLPDVFKGDDRNIYYDLSTLGHDSVMKSAMFVNLLAYVTNRALNNEVIVIHGLDEIDVPEFVLQPFKDRIERKNIGLVTTFEQSNNTKTNPKTMQNFIGRLSNQDMVILGGTTSEEISYINDSWRRPMPAVVSETLMVAEPALFYFYRKRDYTGALIDTHLNL